MHMLVLRFWHVMKVLQFLIIRQGKIIVNITQCSTGSVKMHLYETGLQLLESGIISGADLTVEAALTKLMFLLGKRLPHSEIRSEMRRNICGELTDN